MAQESGDLQAGTNAGICVAGEIAVWLCVQGEQDMRILGVLAVAAACFGAGTVAGTVTAPFTQWLIRYSSGTQTPRCVASSFCVGDDAAEAFGTFRLSESTGGVQLVECGKQSDWATYRAGFKLAELPAWVRGGWTCAEPSYHVILGNSEFQTNVQVEGGKIAKITRYSRPNIDP